MTRSPLRAWCLTALCLATASGPARAASPALCTPADNLLAAACVGTLASTSMVVHNDLFGFFLGRRPTYTETEALTGPGDRRLRASGSPDWNRISEVWATQGAALETHLAYPAPAGGTPLLAEATAGAQLGSGRIGVSTRNIGLAHRPANGYALHASAFGQLAEVISVTAPAAADSVTVRARMTVSGSVLEDGPSLGAFAYASARLGIARLHNGSPSDGQFDVLDIVTEGPALGTIVVVATALRPADVPLDLPFTTDFRIAGRLQTGVVNMQYPYSLDFGHTAAFDIEVPPDVTWSSSSGVFLAQAVPEPGSVPMLVLGALGVVLVSRRSRTAAARPPGR